jgi:hypothetical protein
VNQPSFRIRALAVLLLGTIATVTRVRPAMAEEEAGTCVWCINTCANMNANCQGLAPNCTASWLNYCSSGCVSIYGTTYSHKLTCGGGAE